MLNQQDLEMIRIVMKEEITASEERMEKLVDTRIAASENLILGELDRVHVRLQDQIDQLNRKIDEMTEYYRIKKLDDVNDAILLQMIKELEKRVEALKKKSA